MKLEMKSKLNEWSKRYLPAEIVSSVSMLIITFLIFHITQNYIIAAFIGSISEISIFYLIIISIEIKNESLKLKNKNKKYTSKHFTKTLRNLTIKFGPGELIDPLIIRPFFLWLIPSYTSNYTFGIIIGKIIADILFYIPTIIMFELRKKYFKN